MKKIFTAFIFCLLSIVVSAKELKMENLKSDVFTTENNKKIEIFFIKHASLIINYDNKLIYIDPITEYADFSKFPKADLILITHEHYDHLDKQAIENLSKDDTEIILNSNSQKILNSGKIMSNGDELVVLNNINIKAVPAYNITPEHLQFHPKGRDNGYVLTLDNMKIYIAGDTENIDEMNNLKDIDIAFLPVNQPYTMTIEQANLATKMINPKIFYPYHYGNTKIEELSKLLKESDIDIRIRNME